MAVSRAPKRRAPKRPRILTYAAAVRLSGYRSTGLGDDGGFSALHRPGSWEYQLPDAAAARDRLARLGYVEETDPNVSWRVRWVLPIVDGRRG